MLTASYTWAFGSRGTVIANTATMTAVIGALLIGLQRGTPRIVRPNDPLRDDLIFGCAFGLAGGVWAGLPGGLKGGILDSFQILNALDNHASAAMAIVLGIMSGLAMGSRAFVRYAAAIAIGAPSGRLPWWPRRFLNWAHQTGFLRASGLAYQFRHDTLRVWMMKNRSR